MPSKRFEEFIKNASPEVKARIDKTSDKLKDDGVDMPLPAEPKSFDSPDSPPQRRIDLAMAERQEAKSGERSKVSEKAEPAREPER